MTSIPHEAEPSDQAPARRLVRSRDGRWLAGVSAGLGRYFDVSPLVYRIAFAALVFAGGTGIVLYLAAWLVIPDEDAPDSIAVEALREHRERPWLLLGVGLLGLAAILLLSEASVWPGSGNVWLAALLGGSALVWWNIAHRGDAAPKAPAAHDARSDERVQPPRRPSLLGPVAGVLLAGIGLAGLLDVLNVIDVDAAVALAVATAIVGVGVVGGAATGRRVGGLVLLGVALLAAFGVAAASPVPLSSGIGDRNERPLTATELESEYALGIGDLTVDLGAVAFAPGRTSVRARLGLGNLEVIVPAGAGLELDAHSGAGSVDVLGRKDDGAGADAHVVVPATSPGAPVLVLDATVGVGDLTVRAG